MDVPPRARVEVSAVSAADGERVHVVGRIHERSTVQPDVGFGVRHRTQRGARCGNGQIAEGKKESSSASAIVEIGQNLIATGENGQKLEHQAYNPMTMRSLEFEASVPGAFTVYLEETQQVSKLATLKGELLVTPAVC